MTKIIAGNWKLNGDLSFCKAYCDDLLRFNEEQTQSHEMILCPPMPYLSYMSDRLSKTKISVGSQDCSMEEKGAFTGEISSFMAKESGAEYVIVGHSERRQFYGETNQTCAKKLDKVYAQGLKAIYCIGESKEERQSGETFDILERQLKEGLLKKTTAINTVVAYEPIWAIGTGEVATLEDIQETHEFIFNFLKDTIQDGQNVKILYGGSVKSENAASILSIPHVGGVLVGGASLKVNDFINIYKSAA